MHAFIWRFHLHVSHFRSHPFFPTGSIQLPSSSCLHPAPFLLPPLSSSLPPASFLQFPPSSSLLSAPPFSSLPPAPSFQLPPFSYLPSAPLFQLPYFSSLTSAPSLLPPPYLSRTALSIQLTPFREPTYPWAMIANYTDIRFSNFRSNVPMQSVMGVTKNASMNSWKSNRKMDACVRFSSQD